MTKFAVYLSNDATTQLQNLSNNPALVKRYKAVRKTIGTMQANIRYPGLKTHKYLDMTGSNGEEVFEAYAENNTPGAYRIFWHYGPDRQMITIIAITPHP